jgi:hypothetical protein
VICMLVTAAGSILGISAAYTPDILNRTPHEFEGSIRNPVLLVTLGTGPA